MKTIVKNRISTIIILMICSLTTAAQSQVYEIHPIVGDTIDNYEINRYHLFPEYTQGNIDYLILYKVNDLFNLVGITDSASVFDIQISKEEVLLQKEHIEKLNNYYISILKKDSIDLNEYKYILPVFDSLKIDLNFMTPEFVRSMKKEYRRKFWEDKRKETKRNRERGMIF